MEESISALIICNGGRPLGIMSGKPLVSVLVPTYNAAQNIEKALVSISAQTYQSIEVICVNDCSTDNTRQVIEGVANKYFASEGRRLHLVDLEENGGVANARNIALDKASGEYIYFIDSDDYIGPDTISVLMDAAQKHNADVCGMEYILEYNKRKRHIEQANVSSGIDALKALAEGRLHWNLWLYLIRREIIEANNLRFVRGDNMGEDLMMMGCVFVCADIVHVTHSPYYHYIQTNAAAITKSVSKTDMHARQAERNMRKLESFVKEKIGETFSPLLSELKIRVRMPLLFETDVAFYRLWSQLYPETNNAIGVYNARNKQEKFVLCLAARRQYRVLWIYMRVRRFIYDTLFG